MTANGLKFFYLLLIAVCLLPAVLAQTAKARYQRPSRYRLFRSQNLDDEGYDNVVANHRSLMAMKQQMTTTSTTTTGLPVPPPIIPPPVVPPPIVPPPVVPPPVVPPPVVPPPGGQPPEGPPNPPAPARSELSDGVVSNYANGDDDAYDDHDDDIPLLENGIFNNKFSMDYNDADDDDVDDSEEISNISDESKTGFRRTRVAILQSFLDNNKTNNTDDNSGQQSMKQLLTQLTPRNRVSSRRKKTTSSPNLNCGSNRGCTMKPNGEKISHNRNELHQYRARSRQQHRRTRKTHCNQSYLPRIKPIGHHNLRRKRQRQRNRKRRIRCDKR